MLGEPIGESRGKITGTRVPPFEGEVPKVEVSFESSGKLLGIELTEIGTYWSIVKPDGFLYGEGQGIMVTKDGETVKWKGQGVGKPTGKGSAASWRGAVYYQTSSKNLARLNGIAAVFEYEADENGNTQAKFWEWK
jgi:hypothetical protein